ncbi:MAG: hypothetical protein ACREK9_22540, partial [Candidatus Rokuibacteriota bacterium]
VALLPPRADRSPVAKPAAAAPVRGVFQAEGDYWTIAFRGAPFRLRGSVGLSYIARLLARPHREMHVVELAGAPPATGADARRLGQGDVRHAADLGDAGDLLDARARASYRQRLEQLDDVVADAEARGDPEAALRARGEIEALAAQIAAAVGLGGRGRVAAAHTERARVRVTKAIRTSVGKIREHDPSLAEHLDRSVRTGALCVYSPDPALRVDWAVVTS